MGSGVRAAYDAAMSDPDSPPATTAEQTFVQAVAAAEAARRQAKAAAFTAYCWNSLNLAAYQDALADAEVAYVEAVKVARDAADRGVLTPQL